MNFPYPSCSVSSPPAMALSATTGVTKSSRMSRPTTTSCHGAVSSWMPRKKKVTMRGALMAIALHATIDHFPTLSHKEAPSMNSAIMATGTSSIKMSAQLLKKSTSQWPSSSDKGPKRRVGLHIIFTGGNSSGNQPALLLLP